MTEIGPIQLKNLIRDFRGQRVILDADLATLFGVTTKRLNQQVKRNADRFGVKYAFQLNKREFAR
jgi:hypothetical protein